MKNRSLFFNVSVSIFLLFLYSEFSPVNAQTCTDNDGDTYFVEGGACGTVDCDDDDANVHPGAAEICDGKDSNCDGWAPPTDVDSDGDGVAACAGDCDDNDASSYPGAVELCGDGKDNNCNWFTDEAGCICPDADGDGADAAYCGGTDCDDSDPNVQTNCVGCSDNDADGVAVEGGSCGPVDCDDTDPNVKPGAPEICDGKDSNCDGWRPPNDVDNDGDGIAVCANDCDDNNADTYPGAAEICDGNDNNCDYVLPPDESDSDGDGFITCGANIDCDDNDPSVNPNAQEVCNDNVDNNCNGQTDETPCICPDADNDGHQAAICGGSDCDDSDPAINPGTIEVCDSVDNNCDGAVDEGFDADGDGYGDCVDCDDNDPNVHPGAADICDGKDTDCDGFQAPTDVDNDGDGVALCANDCDDNNSAVFPGSPELCDGIDNNCDYVIPLDERDADNDGFRVCDAVADCNDSDPNIFPGSIEECDNLDNDCNGSVDETCVCTDADGDGQVSDHPLCGGQDCDNTDPTVYFGAAELCGDGKDNDCDGLTDFLDPDRVNCPVECVDNDLDGYFVDSSSTGINCGPQDCNDNDPDVHPGAAEICDGKDTDCDGWKPSSDVDNDGDGVAICAGDCDDNDPLRSPNIIEHPLRDNCGDGVDNDCDSLVDAIDSSCAAPNCETKTSPKDVPHFFTLLNPDDTVHPDNGTLICEKCHAAEITDPVRFACQRCHADPADASDPLNGTLKALYPLDPPYGYGSAPDVNMHDSTIVGTQYGGWTMGAKGCVTCHNPHAQEQDNLFGNDYGMYIKEYICYDNDVTLQSVEEFVELTAPSGTGSFADGGPHTANVCEMCHTQTNHHQRDGSAPGGQSHLDGQKCTYCHVHVDGFLPTNSDAASPHNTDFFNADCKLCHVSTGPNPEDIDFQTRIPDATCQNCHGERTSHTGDTSRNPDASGNYTYNIMCVDCHNPMLPVDGNRKLIRPYLNFDRADGSGNVNESTILNTTRRGPESLGDGAPFDENLCNSCHSLTSHSNVNGDGGHFTGQYCMVCHDHDKSFMLPGKTCLEENVAGVNCGQ